MKRLPLLFMLVMGMVIAIAVLGPRLTKHASDPVVPSDPDISAATGDDLKQAQELLEAGSYAEALAACQARGRVRRKAAMRASRRRRSRSPAPEIVEPLLVEGLIEDKLEDQARARSILEFAIAIARARAPEGGDQATAQDVPAEPAEEPGAGERRRRPGDRRARLRIKTVRSRKIAEPAVPQPEDSVPTEAGDEPAAETPADQSPEAQAAAARQDRELLLAKGMTVLANLYLSGEQLDKAEALLHEAIGHQEHALWVGYKFSPEAAETLNALASLYSQQGREDDANVLRQRASSMDLRNSFLLKFDDQTRDFLSTYSLPPDQLAAHIEGKLAEAEGELGTSHPDLLPWLERLGDSQVQLKQFAEAEAVEGRALAIAEKSFRARAREARGNSAGPRARL